MKHLPHALSLAGVLLLCRAASAQEATEPAPPEANPTAAVCSESYQGAQLTRREGKSALLQAREAARTCLSAGCLSWMTTDCSQWLNELEARIPTVVFSAKNTAGRDLSEITVSTTDGQTIVAQLTGHALEYEPGPHTFVFVDPAGARREKQVIVREGAKAQVIEVEFDASPEELAALERARPAPAPEAPPPPASPNVLRYVGFGALGLGAIGLGLGTGFGISAIVQKGNLNCDANNVCEGSPAAGARAADISTAAFIAGGVLAAGGLALVLLPRSSSKITAQPSLGPAHAGLQLGGHF